MPETDEESAGTSIARTTLSERDLIIHAVQHLEDVTDRLVRLEGMAAQVAEIYEALNPLRPLIEKLGRRKMGLFP